MIFSQNHRLLLPFLLLLLSTGSACASLPKGEKRQIDRVDPPFWWVDMKETSLELIFHAPSIGVAEVTIKETDTKITKITRPQNGDYLFVELEVSASQLPGMIEFTFTNKAGKTISHFYELKKRTQTGYAQGVGPEDLIYLIFPDRFANGNPANDAVPSMNEKTADRNVLKARHGGDLKGISDHLSYVLDIGSTALWINPVLENNQDYESYHGYAATDHYRIDPRLGTNEQFKELVASCHDRGIKVIWDVVYNHWGNFHYLHQALPDSNWVHWFPKFTRTNYRTETLLDPYASEFDKNLMSNAWFDKHMPDLNQNDPHLAAYLIQQSIWWIEYAGLDAFRIDTYAYPDQRFMKELNERIRSEYPDFVLFGETWVQGSPIQAWFTEKNGLNKAFSSELHSVTDFQLYYAILKGLNEPFGWEEGFSRIQMTLSHDILYHDPFMNVTFLDNHDLSRYYSTMGEDMVKWKMGLTLMMTLRGIPSVYYGTEILMKNYANPDALVREDFPGGWPGDSLNKFVPEGRTALENEGFNFYRNLANWRKSNSWIGRATLTQFVPVENTYVYFRHDDGHTVMCAYNLNEKEVKLDLQRFEECLRGRTTGKEILTGVPIEFNSTLNLASKSVSVIFLN